MKVYTCLTRYYDNEYKKYSVIQHTIIAKNCFEAAEKLRERIKDTEREFDITTTEFSIREER